MNFFDNCLTHFYHEFEVDSNVELTFQIGVLTRVTAVSPLTKQRLKTVRVAAVLHLTYMSNSYVYLVSITRLS